MEGMTYLALGYLGMLIAIAIWTFTVVRRSQRIHERLSALESILPSMESEMVQNAQDE